MIGPIDGRGGWLPGGLVRPADLYGAVGTSSAAGPKGLSDAAAAVQISETSVVEVYSEVSQMLQAVGGGARQDPVLKMLIALMVLVALVQQQQSGSAAATILDMLSQHRAGLEQEHVSWSYSALSVESTSTTLVAYQDATAPQATAPAPTALDISA